MQPKTSQELPQSPPRKDEERERRDAAVVDADKTDQSDRNLVHGDGKDIGLDKH